ncbi:hypothetical protein [Streptomyces capitiformicae]|uniref:Uncharacterized protein n=1 Tax=Streptomyces capitiformicae TaxID=2014920 RepID=A0A919GKR1_9ACTN|nr:hypothetical protein [Streptomyces capitiformicae]GHH85803.1 hypothetical protein GCM10017771_20330 [Streptomyces capitiformicae]
MQLLLLAIGLAALLWPVARRPAWLAPAVRTGLPPLVTLAYVMILVGARRMGAFSPGEAVLLLYLLVSQSVPVHPAGRWCAERSTAPPSSR